MSTYPTHPLKKFFKIYVDVHLFVPTITPMPAPIYDQYSLLPISRQARYARRKQDANCCRICGKPGDWLCAVHRAKQTQYNLKSQAKRREAIQRLEATDGSELV